MVTRRTFLTGAAAAVLSPLAWGRAGAVKVGVCTRDIAGAAKYGFDYIEPAAAEIDGSARPGPGPRGPKPRGRLRAGVHARAADRDSRRERYRAVKRKDAKTPVFPALKAASAMRTPPFSCPATASRGLTRGPRARANNSSASVSALIDKI